MSSFYVHLESDSSYSHFQDNTVSDFRNYLNPPIALEPNSYEVALLECSYPPASVRFRKGAFLFRVENYDKVIYNVFAKSDIKNIEDLMRNLSFHIQVCTFKNNNGFCEISSFNFDKEDEERYAEKWRTKYFNYLVFDFNPNVAEILGFPLQTIKQHEQNVLTSENKINFVMPNSRYYVYCDIVENQHVGDTSAPILRSFLHDKNSNHQNSKIFLTSHYIPVSKPQFDSIHMYIRNQFAEAPPFNSGSFSSTLHFRRKRL